MRKSPLVIVKERFGSKEELANQLIPMLERPEEEAAEDFERRIRTASNRKLLRLHAAEERVREDFGSKDALIDAIMKLKFSERPEDKFRERLSGYAKTRLLDLHAQLVRASGE